jgi:methionyl-tRNA formyltransferase
MRLVFLGTPEFAIPSLKSLVQGGHNVLAVFTQPDRPKGRGNRLSESPVKIAARELGLAVHQPERIRRPEIVDALRSLESDLMVVVGYGQIIPQAIIDLPQYGILNVHGSLLPKYRGAAPIQWAIANGETETGVTIMQIDAGLDTGDMLLKAALSIGPEETAPELSARLAPLGAQLLVEALDRMQAGRICREKQNDAEATYAPILKKEDGRIDWQRPAVQIYNRLRGFTPWPAAYTSFRGQPLHILEAKPLESAATAQANRVPGLLRIDKHRLFAVCGHDTELELLELQPAGRKRMSAGSFLNGYEISENERLGEQN